MNDEVAHVPGDSTNDSHHQLALADLRGAKYCVTGRLLTFTHDELAEVIRAAGGQFLAFPRRGSCRLVVGDGGWPAENDGTLSRVYERARTLRDYGYPIEFIDEQTLLEQLGLASRAEAVRGPHSLAELARILQVPPARIRRWMRLKLIEPTVVRHRLAYFDFDQVAFARRLCETLERGAALTAIREGIARVRSELPAGERLLQQLAGLETDGRVIIRRRDRLLDDRGQQYFDFESGAGEQQPPIIVKPIADRLAIVDLLFDQAVTWEDAGQFEDAATAYAQALQLAPGDAVLHFNLGNVQYQLARWSAAEVSFRSSLALEPDYVEAWNNLGGALAAQGNWQAAAEAYRQALRLVPTYADAHHNLAVALKRLGRAAEAQHHFDQAELLAIAYRCRTAAIPAGDDPPQLRLVRADEPL